MNKQLQLAPQYNNRAQPFTVDAGKIEGFEAERNSKFCDSFATLEEAMAAAATCIGYHYIDVEYVDAQGNVWLIDLQPKMVEA